MVTDVKIKELSIESRLKKQSITIAGNDDTYDIQRVLNLIDPIEDTNPNFIYKIEYKKGQFTENVETTLSKKEIEKMTNSQLRLRIIDSIESHSKSI